MPSILVIRLHPEEPVTAEDFTGSLNNLSVNAYELSFNNLDGSGTPTGTATYIPPTSLPDSPQQFSF